MPRLGPTRRCAMRGDAMLDPKTLSEFDQSAMQTSDTVPPALARFFKCCVAQGFTHDQAMAFCLEYLRFMFNPQVE